jgi:hypothetical protein
MLLLTKWLEPNWVLRKMNMVTISKIGESRSIFASHLDTVSREHTKVNHVINGNMISTDGTTTLEQMIKQVFLYLFG